MRLSKNLSRSEFVCRCSCGFNAVDIELITLIQGAADYFKKMHKADRVFIIITSGNRCARHNAIEGGVYSSQHILGIAADHKIKVKIKGNTFTVDAEDLAAYYSELHPEKLGIGIYPKGRVHLDVREFPARWNKG